MPVPRGAVAGPGSPPITVLVLTPSVGGHYFGELIAGIGREVAGVGGRIVLVQTLDGGSRSDEESEVSGFAIPVAWSRVDGAIAVTTAVRGSYLHQLRAAGKPVVLASTRMADFSAPLALPDNRGGTVAAVEHLISHGHARIGFVGNLAQPDVRDRYAAYREVLESHDLTADPMLVFEAPNNDFPGGALAAAAVLACPARPSALMVATDRNAIGLMRALNTAGLTIPGDIAVVGFDNMEAAAFNSPTLTSVAQRFDDVGALAGRLLLAQLRGEDVSFTAHTPPTPRLELRGSCGCATDALGTGVIGRGPAPEATPEAVRTELQTGLAAELLTGHRTVDDSLWKGVLETVAAAERLMLAGSGITAADIQHLTTSLDLLAPRPDLLRRVASVVMRYVRRAATTTDPGAGADGTVVGDLSQLTTALWQLEAGAFLQQAEMTEVALKEQYIVGTRMLDPSRSDPRTLEWLADTHVRAGVLALWEDGPTSGRLRMAGTFDPDGLLRDLADTVTTPEQFPPEQLMAVAQGAHGGVCIVVPVCTRNDQWGLLAFIGEINATSALEPYRHWATQLCASFEAQVLQEAVRESEQRYAFAAQASNDGLWEWNTRTDDFYLSERCFTLLGVEPDPQADRLAMWTSRIHPDDLPVIRDLMQRLGDGEQETAEREYRVRAANGSYRWVLARALGVRSPDGGVERVVGSLSDVHERRSLEEQLRENALYDPLTGLPNRRLFLTRLDHAVALWQRSRTPFAVIFLDLDGFKAINDSLGHQMGDRVLNVVGTRIAHELRGVDTGARFGGDEFAILLDGTGHDEVLRIAMRVQAQLLKVIELDGHEFMIGASLGVATSALGYTSAEDVLRDADTAMYRAKETQRGTLSFFDAAMHSQATHELQLNIELRRAVEDGQFEMRYQPIVNLITGHIDRFEALVRWRHPERGLLLPDEFLPAMAATGTIIQLGHWVIDEVCRQLAAWGPGVANVAVNASNREFWHGEFLEHLLQSLRRHDLTADRLTLEITEGVIMRRPEVALGIMRELHDAGVRLHIEDFGTGRSSLATLHRFPVDAFKIDLLFIAELTTGGHVEELLRAILSMGRALGLGVVAEGVETREQLALLQEIGCVTGQGFLFMPAVTGDRVPALLGRVLGQPKPGAATGHQPRTALKAHRAVRAG